MQTLTCISYLILLFDVQGLKVMPAIVQFAVRLSGKFGSELVLNP